MVQTAFWLLSCGYTRLPLDSWAPLATLALDSAYEATLWAAAIGAPNDCAKPRRVWLTLLGGGAFGNRIEWIGHAIGHALAKAKDAALDIRIGHYGQLNTTLIEHVDQARASALG